MPGRDKTGPEGLGPLTGRGMGIREGGGRGFGRGYGHGGRMRVGLGHAYGTSSYENIPEVSQKTLLENEIRILKDQLSYFEKQLSELEKDDWA